jgi:hypothetical protein
MKDTSSPGNDRTPPGPPPLAFPFPVADKTMSDQVYILISDVPEYEPVD